MKIKTLFGAFVGFGCGGLIVGVGLGGTGCSGTPEVDEFAVALATTYCEALEGCCKKASFEYDEASCKAQLTNDIQRSADVVKRGKVTYEKDAAEACIDAYKSRAALCSEDAGTPPPASGFEPHIEACIKVFKGTVAPGGECTESAECVADFPREIGTCSADNRPGADRTKKVCYKLVKAAAGEDCSSAKPTDLEVRQCDPATAYCEGATPGAARKCRAYAKVGENCGNATAGQCDPRAGLFCDFASQKCAGLPAAGQPCSVTFQCAKGAFCERATTPTGANTCVAQRPDGTECDSGAQCASGSCPTDPTPTSDGGRPKGKCGASVDNTANSFEVTPRSCGFGPSARGPVDGGIVQTQSILKFR